MTALRADAPAMPATTRRRLRSRHLWIIPGLAIAVYANGLSAEHSLGLVPLLLFGILPKLPFFLGIGQPTVAGQLPSRAVPLWNVMHHPAVPGLMLGVAFTGLLSPFWTASGLAWLSHIVIDWGLGDGLRSRDGFRLPGIGRLIGVGGA
jgi:hypothetical protein